MNQKNVIGATGVSNQIRKVIEGFGGKPFRSTHLPRYKSLHSLLAKLIKTGELRRWEEYPDVDKRNNQPRIVYQEIKLKQLELNEEPAPKVIDEAWHEVYPEFYRTPEFSGVLHVYKQEFE